MGAVNFPNLNDKPKKVVIEANKWESHNEKVLEPSVSGVDIDGITSCCI